MPTTGHGIYYIDSGANTNLWEHSQATAESVETALDATEAWTTWTPTFNTAGVNGGITNFGVGGVNEGYYQRVGDRVFGQFLMKLGTGPTIDSGVFVLTLPVVAFAWGGGAQSQVSVGSWHARNDSAATYYGGSLHTDVTSGVSITFSGAWDGTSPKARITNTLPFVWANLDSLSGSFDYRCAP